MPSTVEKGLTETSYISICLTHMLTHYRYVLFLSLELMVPFYMNNLTGTIRGDNFQQSS